MLSSQATDNGRSCSVKFRQFIFSKNRPFATKIIGFSRVKLALFVCKYSIQKFILVHYVTGIILLLIVMVLNSESCLKLKQLDLVTQFRPEVTKWYWDRVKYRSKIKYLSVYNKSIILNRFVYCLSCKELQKLMAEIILKWLSRMIFWH